MSAPDGRTVITTRDTASFDDDGVVVPAGTAGTIIGDGFDVPPHGEQFVAVDFGNVACDVRVADLASLAECTCPPDGFNAECELHAIEPG